MGGRLPVETAAVRAAVRACLADVPAGGTVCAAVSGGDDSLALVGALAFLGPRHGWRTVALVVDHGWTPGSAARCAAVARRCEDVLDEAQVLTVSPTRTEAAAREVRYAALDDAAAGAPVLLGHTLDDQAETVLLGLARGSGTRSLAGMAAVRGAYRRPLLGLHRTVVAAARAQVLPGDTYDDPANADPAFARVRVRRDALPALEAALGPGVADALARTAALARDDAELLDELAVAASGRCGHPAGGLDVAALAAEPAALRGRVLRTAALGVAGTAPTAVQVAAVDALVTDWHGQGPVALGGGASASRDGGRVVLAPAAPGVG